LPLRTARSWRACARNSPWPTSTGEAQDPQGRGWVSGPSRALAPACALLASSPRPRLAAARDEPPASKQSPWAARRTASSVTTLWGPLVIAVVNLRPTEQPRGSCTLSRPTPTRSPLPHACARPPPPARNGEIDKRELRALLESVEGGLTYLMAWVRAVGLWVTHRGRWVWAWASGLGASGAD
jgi:hypothetical protein